jgi:hypothetical protein
MLRKKFAIAVAAGTLIGGVGIAGAVDAGEPAKQACIGDLFNKAGRPFPDLTVGSFVSASAKGPAGEDPNFGQRVNAIQAGFVPDFIFPNDCNIDPE